MRLKAKRMKCRECGIIKSVYEFGQRDKGVSKKCRKCTAAHLSTLPENNVLEVLRKYGHDEGWEPKAPEEPTVCAGGTEAKIEVLRARVSRGEGLWHTDDREDFEGLHVEPKHERERTSYFQ